jgi:hypothetical protein
MHVDSTSAMSRDRVATSDKCVNELLLHSVEVFQQPTHFLACHCLKYGSAGNTRAHNNSFTWEKEQHDGWAGQRGSRCCVQCKVIRNEIDCPQLPCMVSMHFEALRHLNEQFKAGTLQHDPLNLPMSQLLDISQESEDSGGSSIVRFCSIQGAYAVHPAIECRITCLSSNGASAA